ncbi:MAG: YkgJ family cysteine cluster protein [Campylobacterota bacterium]|nr:YkgJ family cysteine cluster protein [Campylobacterota bacterium]
MLEHKDYKYKFDENICSTCDGNCCIGESGYIWISKDEIVKLASYLNINVEELAYRYLFKVGYKFSIKEKQLTTNSYACIFFDIDKKQCGIYDARPNQCRTFPFWEYFKNNIKEVKEECPAIVD